MDKVMLTKTLRALNQNLTNPHARTIAAALLFGDSELVQAALYDIPDTKPFQEFIPIKQDFVKAGAFFNIGLVIRTNEKCSIIEERSIYSEVVFNPDRVPTTAVVTWSVKKNLQTRQSIISAQIAIGTAVAEIDDGVALECMRERLLLGGSPTAHKLAGDANLPFAG